MMCLVSNGMEPNYRAEVFICFSLKRNYKDLLYAHSRMIKRI